MFEKVASCVLTSATLTSNASVEFIRSRLGVAKADELIAESNFDFKEQALIYLPQGIPDPRDRGFAEAAAEEIIKLLNITQGRAFVLSISYGSYGGMQALRQLVEPEIDFPVLMQGEGARSGLLDKFRATPNSVLFTTASFWQGVERARRELFLRHHRQAALCRTLRPRSRRAPAPH
ncbi:MAG: hypothetical protein HOP19_13395 [Acidobacteria bacterium]|nr:hypothetical protein [Acidobacteriota bacterium]